MQKENLTNQIIESLKTQGGTTTRGLCNRIFLKSINGHIIIPGKDKMRLIYYRLRKLEKSRIVKLDYPGYWMFSNLESKP